MGKNYYYNIPVVRMGQWSLLPLDSENWHGEETSKYFKKVFGFSKGTLALHDIRLGLQYPCFPKSYVDKLYQYIGDINSKDFCSLEKKLNNFYKLKKLAKSKILKISAGLDKISNKKLIRLFINNRDWAHRAAVYDQFGWIAEDYWNPIMEKLITAKFNVPKNSKQYFKVLFTLTKPKFISTTLEERKNLLQAAINIYNDEKSDNGIKSESIKLSKKFGWMPVFTYGTPWDSAHYKMEIVDLLKKPQSELLSEFDNLKNYSINRKLEINKLVKQYKISKKDLQIFLDFALVLDARNEAEYIISFAGFHLLPIYKEIARRLAVSVRQLRCLFESEIIDSLNGKIDIVKLLHKKGNYVGWSFNETMDKRINFTAEETKKLLEYLNKTAPLLQGDQENQGVCACSGSARGKAKIVLSPDENDKVEAGDILITHATTVDYLPAMKKAVAIVTEVGGLTCHAAVVSREFNIPCVVGLKNATKLFKDGDKIIVDADRASVTKSE